MHIYICTYVDKCTFTHIHICIYIHIYLYKCIGKCENEKIKK